MRDDSTRKKKPITPENLKEVALNLYSSGSISITECAQTLGSNRSTLSKVIQRNNDVGGITASERQGHTKLLTDKEGDELCDILDEDCTKSLKDLKDYCLQKFGKNVSLSTISRMLKAFHYSFKRTSIVPGSPLSERTIELRLIMQE